MYTMFYESGLQQITMLDIGLSVEMKLCGLLIMANVCLLFLKC